MTNFEGQTFAGYEILSKLGQGGMGAVYKARQPKLDRLVALKIMATELAGDPDFVARFKREASAAAALNHENIVQVFSAGESENTHFIAMEFVEGDTLRHHIESHGRLDPREAIAVTILVAQALQYAWNKARIIHRDIKPENIFLSNTGDVKVGDLGLAKTVGGGSTSLTQTGMMMGSPHYISPEQARGLSDIDFRTDIYSLGCTLYHMLTGRPPYTGTDPLVVINKHVNEPPPAIFKVWPTCPIPLALLVGKMLAKQRHERPASYEDLIEQLHEVRDKLKPATTVAPVGASEPTQVLPTPAPAPAQPTPKPAIAKTPTQAPKARESKPATRNSKLVIGGAVAAAALLLGGLFLWSPWKTEPRSESRLQAEAASGQPAEAGTPNATFSATENWQDFIAEARRSGSIPNDFKDDGSAWVRSGGTVTVLAKSIRDGAVRVTFTFPDGKLGNVGLNLRYDGNAGRGYQSLIAPSCVTVVRTEHGERTTIATGTLPAGFDPKQEITLELRVVGDELNCKLNGQTVATCRDSTFSREGQAALYCRKMGTRFSRIEVLNLDGVSTSVISSDSALKQLGNVYKNAVGAEMVYIPPGEFMMGSTPEERTWAVQNRFSENAVKVEGVAPHRAAIKQGFWMGRTEVTVGQWKQFVATTSHVSDGERNGDSVVFQVGEKLPVRMKGKSWRDPGFGSPPQDNHPVCCVSWNDAKVFCDWLTQRERQAGRLPAGFVVRLPTEAEWEYACRAGTQTKFWWGDSKEDGMGRVNWQGTADGYEYVAPVDSFGERGRNRFGLADMQGNVSEVCLDEFDPTQPHETVWTSDSSKAVTRGSNFSDLLIYCRSASRNYTSTSVAHCAKGFRVCLGPDVLGSATAPVTSHESRVTSATENWQDWIAEQRRNGTMPKDFNDDGGVWLCPKAGTALTLAKTIRNGALRVTYTLPKENSVQVVLELRNRRRDKTAYGASIGAGYDNWLVYRAEQGQIKKIAQEKLPAGFDPNGEVTFEFRVVGEELTCKVNGQTVVACCDSTLNQEGDGSIRCTKPGIRISRIEVLNLDGAKLLTSTPPPTITNWHDSMKVICFELEKKRTGRFEDGWAIAGSDGSGAPNITFRPAQDVAIRGRFRNSNCQVLLTLSEDHKTFYSVDFRRGDGTLNRNRVEGSSGRSRLGTEVIGVLQYPAANEHDFLITRVGALLSVWVDGVFAGSARDTTLTSGTSAIGFRRAGDAVRDVATADLSAAAPAPADAGWLNAINLLPLIDPARDALEGEWRMENGELVGDAASFARVEIPYQPPKEYDFRTVFRRQTGQGAVWQILAGNGHSFDWCIAGDEGKWFGFETIEGKLARSNPSGVPMDQNLENARFYTSEIQVRTNSVKGFLDGKPIVEWKTDYKNMALTSALRLRTKGLLGVGARLSSVVFHRIEVREVTGKGTFTRDAPASAAQQPRQTIDLLALTDHEKDRVPMASLWTREGQSLAYRGRANARLVAPVAIHARTYEIEVEFERQSDKGRFHVDLPVPKNRHLAVCIGQVKTFNGSMGETCPEPVQGRNRVIVRMEHGNPGQQDHVSVWFNGAVMADWRGNANSFARDTEPYPEFADQLRPALFTYFPGYKFTAWTLRVFDGEATVLRGPSSTPRLQNSNSPAALPAFCAEVAALPAEQQIARVVAKLKELNPGYDGQETHKIENGIVTELKFSTIAVADISPVRALQKLRVLLCEGKYPTKGSLEDLSPLRGLKLEEIRCDKNPIRDLSPLKGMPLTCLYISSTLVRDLTPLNGMPLVKLNCNGTPIGDLSPLAGAPLESLFCNGSFARDLSPLKGMRLTNLQVSSARVSNLDALRNMPLEELGCNFVPSRDTEILRSIKTLKKINNLPAAEFWKKVEAGEVPKVK